LYLTFAFDFVPHFLKDLHVIANYRLSYRR